MSEEKYEVNPTGSSGGLLTSSIIFSIFTNLLMLTGPLFMLQVYDRVLASRSEETLVALFGLVALLYAFYWLLEYARGRVMARVGARIQARLNEPVFRATIRRAALQNGHKRGALQDLDNIRNLYASPVLLAIFDLPWTPVFVGGVFLFHPLLGWLALAGGGLLVLVAVANQLLTSRRTRSSAEAAQSAAAIAQQAQNAGPVVWAQGMLPSMQARWVARQRSAMEAALNANDWTGSFTAFTKSFRLFLQSAMLALGAWLVLQSSITAGAMIAASILLGRALAPIEVVVSQWQLVQRARSSRKDLQTLLKSLPERAQPLALPEPEAKLHVSKLSLIIGEGNEPTLKVVSLSVEPGEALGVIGRSGAGKSTLARAIVGLVEPTSGEVRLSGATLEQYGPERLGSYIGYLPQDIHVFDGTVAENIAHMERAPDATKVVDAAQKARVHDIILKLPNGYDTPIRQADGQLSGGQKQRLALARALYNNPVLLVLDEPNSALDAEGSEALNRVIASMKDEGKAIVIMTHRPTAISSCDNLIVLENGGVAASGPRDEVVRSMMKNSGDVQRVIKGVEA